MMTSLIHSLSGHAPAAGSPVWLLYAPEARIGFLIESTAPDGCVLAKDETKALTP